MIKELEQKPDSFDFAERKQALSALFEKVQGGEITLPKADTEQICLAGSQEQRSFRHRQ